MLFKAPASNHVELTLLFNILHYVTFKYNLILKQHLEDLNFSPENTGRQADFGFLDYEQLSILP